jgi:hypothetical protein
MHRVIRLITLLFVTSSAWAAPKKQEQPPERMIPHYEWCGKGATEAVRLKRYEGFWTKYRPQEDDGYEDSPHITFVRLTAYRLAEGYAATGNVKRCREMLHWLEKTDEVIPR